MEGDIIGAFWLLSSVGVSMPPEGPHFPPTIFQRPKYPGPAQLIEQKPSQELLFHGQKTFGKIFLFVIFSLQLIKFSIMVFISIYYFFISSCFVS